MYVAVVLVLLGWAALFRSFPLLVYTLVVTIGFHLRRSIRRGALARARRTATVGCRYAARVPRWFLGRLEHTVQR